MAANIESFLDEGKNLTSFIVQGKLETHQVIDTIHVFFSCEPTKYVLWDFSQAQIAHLSRENVMEVVESVNAYAERKIVAKTALVFSEDVAFGLGRMFEILNEMEESLQEFMSFRNIDDANEWLASG